MILLFTNLFLLAGIGITIANYSTSVIQGEAAGSTNVVFAEFYGGGGNNSAPYKKDYAVLFNLSGSSQSLSTWSIQYASSTGSNWSKIDLSGTIQPFRYFLVGLSVDGANGVSLESPDVNSTSISASPTNGKIALMSTQTLISTGTKKPTSGLIDFIGFGTADEREGTSTSDNAPGGSNTFSIKRKNFLIDSDNNKNDFETGTPTPLNSSSKSTTAEIFSNYFLLRTENKVGLCTDQDLEWSSTLESDYNNLSSAQKALFVAGSANATIANAVNRYQYLRTIAPSLTNFANL